MITQSPAHCGDIPVSSVSRNGSAPESYFADCRNRFREDIGLIGMSLVSPGYTTAMPSGTWVHPTVNNFEYAALLLRRGDEESHQLARGILARLLALQDVDPVSRKFGIWPWFADEPLEMLPQPDLNWADFCGGRIADILTEDTGALGDPLRQDLEKALLLAAQSIFRRNVTPDYTNIAIMGAGVCAAAAELTGESWLLDYARRRMDACVKSLHFHGGFNEYNSPPYTSVVIQECERIAFVVKDPEIKKNALVLRRAAWEIIASHFHPATGQWAGPHSRNYSDLIGEQLAAFLSERTGVEIDASQGECMLWTGPINLTIHPLPCPGELVDAFRDPVTRAETREHSFIRSQHPDRSVSGVTWMTPDACLGSVNRGEFWTQRRSILGYWKTTEERAVTLRLRFLKDGLDFGSALVRNDQEEMRILSAVSLATDMGDWHLMLDRPASGEFTARDLRLRYEIRGKGVFVKRLDDSLFALGAGARTAFIHTPPCQFGRLGVKWEFSEQDDCCRVDAVCNCGPEFRFRPEYLSDIRLGAGLELLTDGSEPSTDLPRWEDGDSENNRLRWRDLEASVPRQPGKFFTP